MQQNLLVLGSTGSIGISTLDVAARHPDRFRVWGLVAGANVALLKQQVLAHAPRYVAIASESGRQAWLAWTQTAEAAASALPLPQLVSAEDIDQLSAHPEVDVVMAAIVGAAGLNPTLAALQAGKRVLLANKESLVLAGRFMLQACEKAGGQILPVDSEHNAIYQCLPPQFKAGRQETHGVAKITLTASGGPFRTTPIDQLAQVTPEQAVAHPNWSMGRKISVDSATMANKSLELIEALWLFGVAAQNLDVLIHPQSIVHSMVEYQDGSVLAQLGCPDMRTPIAHVMGYPDRIESGSPRLNLAQLGRLDFEAPDFNRFPMLSLAFEVLQAPEVMAPVFNAANEVAVEKFLAGQLAFTDIQVTVARCLEQFAHRTIQSLDCLFDLDREVRDFARNSLTGR